MDETLLYLAAFCGFVSVAIALAILAVRRDGRGVGELLKQVVVWAGIAALLPLTSWAGATYLHPRTTLKDLTAQRQRAQQEANYGSSQQQQDPATRKAALDEQQRLSKLIDEEQQRYHRAMFWVSFPIGVTTLVAGLLVRAVPVGSALAFGGLCTLSVGCYSYWDDMGDGLRFWSLLLVLATLATIGLLRYGREPTPRGVAVA